VKAPARVLVIVAAVLAMAYVLVRTAWLCDDAYITFRAVENVVNGLGPRWNPGERVQAFTHALWFLVLSGFRAVSGEIYLTSLLVSMGLTLLTVSVLLWRVAGSTAAAAFASLALLSSRAFVDYSTSGLENPLSNLLVVWFVVLWGRDTAGTAPRRLGMLTLVAALLMTNRLDTGLLVLPALLVEAWRLGVRRSVGPVALGAMPFLAWEAFSIVYYGFALPNPVYAKLPPNVPGSALVPHGLMYLTDSLQQDPVTLPVVAAAILIPLIVKPRRDWPLSIGLILSLAVIVRVGGDFMSGRFFTTPFLAAVAFLAHRAWPHRQVIAWVPAAVVVGLGALSPFPPVMSRSDFEGRYEPPSGITDERRYYFQNTGLLRRTGFSTETSTKRETAVTRVIERGQKVAVTISVGFVGYYAGPRLHIIDSAGLADPLMARLPTEVPWRIGHYLRQTPPGYGDTIEHGRNVIEDPGLAMFYEKLSLIIRGPIWSRARWAAMLDMNLGRSTYLLDGYSRRYPGVLATAVLGPKSAGAGSETEAATTFTDVLVIYFDQPRRLHQIEFSLDATHDYRTVYLSRGAERHTGFIAARAPQGSGFAEYRQTVPESTGEVDQVRVLLRRGRGPGRLAYWRMIE